MKEKKILLTSIEEAKRFVTEASRCDFDVDVFYIFLSHSSHFVRHNCKLHFLFLENTFCSHLNTIRDNRNFRESFANVFVFFAPPLSAALRCIFPEYFCSAVQAGQLHNAYDQCSDGTYQKRRNSQHPV